MTLDTYPSNPSSPEMRYARVLCEVLKSHLDQFHFPAYLTVILPKLAVKQLFDIGSKDSPNNVLRGTRTLQGMASIELFFAIRRQSCSSQHGVRILLHNSAFAEVGENCEQRTLRFLYPLASALALRLRPSKPRATYYTTFLFARREKP